MELLKRKNTINDFGFALSNFALIFTYSFCCAVALGQGLISVIFISFACSIGSAALKGKLFCPEPLLLVPVFFSFSEENTIAGILSLLLGSSLYLAFKHIFPNITVSKKLFKVFKILLALCATVLFTNIYFGIGAQGNTPFKMLASYVSLGFHPHFTGLLTGTITLFMMITYPFKFQKLNKYLPAEFVSLAVPYIVNILLNPDSKLTTVNETSFIDSLSLSQLAKCFTFNSDLISILPTVIMGGLLFSVCFFFIFSPKDSSESLLLGLSCCSFSSVCSIPVNTKPTRGLTPRSSLICAGLCIITCVIFPSLLSRVPLHSIGALLIVSSWQQATRKEDQ